MKVTNKLNLPLAFVNAVSVERHNKPNTYSATTLNKGIKETILTDRHWEDLETEASDNVWAVFGTAVHAILEQSKDDNFHEERFEVAVSNSKVSGIVDSYDMENQTIYDWKTASVFKVMKGDFEDWKKQGLTYAWLLKKSGLEVKKCRFVALLKDHSKSKARTAADYPKSPIFVYGFSVTSEGLEETETRIIEKVKELEKAKNFPDDELPPCTKEEKWTQDEKWAVMKDGRKTAVKLFDDENSALNYAETLGKGHYVQFREGIDRKCLDYCPCREFCSHYKRLTAE